MRASLNVSTAKLATVPLQHAVYARRQQHISGDRTGEQLSKLEQELDGVKVVIFDEISMLGLNGLVLIERRLRLSQRNEQDRLKLFGGRHVIF